MITESLNTNKSARICKKLFEKGIEIETPSQTGIWSSTIRQGESMKKIVAKMVQEEQFCLHFDGKKINKTEYQVVILPNEKRKINLGIVKCESGKSNDIFEAFKKLLNDFDAWKCISMIICDTTAVNTGRLNGIVVNIQNEMETRGFTKPQYLGCQHHILDLLLKHVLDHFVNCKSTSPGFDYKFVKDLTENYENLQKNYTYEAEPNHYINLGWRDDFKFLYELCEAFSYFKNHKKLPKIK